MRVFLKINVSGVVNKRRNDKNEGRRRLWIKILKEDENPPMGKGYLEMKEFIGTFLTCLIICYVATFFFGGLILSNLWSIVTLIAFFMSVLITIFIKQETRIEELEKKLENLVNKKADLD